MSPGSNPPPMYNSLPIEAKPDVTRPPHKMVGAYTHERALEDIPGIRHALDLFLASHMVESENYCNESDPEKERLYFASGYGLIQCVKALMSYEDEDLLAAIGHTKHGNTIAQLHRKKAASLASRVAGFVMGTSSNSGINWVKSMTAVERHAELIYAETLFEKALLGIAYSGDWLSFIKEALNLRTTFTTYRLLHQFLIHTDSEARVLGTADSSGHDPTIDADFRSGVLLGAGMSNVILSLMPHRLLSIVELFGFKGNRTEGLDILYSAGGWRPASDPLAAEPLVSKDDEGLRRSIIDMALLIFHLALSSFSSQGIDIPRAKHILRWNAARYPRGIFFLFGQGRLHLILAQPRQAISFYEQALTTQSQYRNLHQISYWEMAIARLALWEIKHSEKQWRTLWNEASWSKACYVYGIACCLLQRAQEEAEGSESREQKTEEAAEWMGRIPSLLQRIAGKSIPMEKFVARKARKFCAQSRYLALPALELAYVFLGIARAPPYIIYTRMLPSIARLRAVLDSYSDDGEKSGTEGYVGGKNAYWDDRCLAWFLEGVCCRYIAYPEPNAEPDTTGCDEVRMSVRDASDRSEAAFRQVLHNGGKITLDHHLVYFAHFELGRLLGCMGQKEEARKHFELVLSGKPLEANTSSRKGKYSLESSLLMRTQGCIEALDEGRPL